LDIRRIALRGLVVAPLVVGGGGAVLLLLPKLVRKQVTARISARTGLPARVGDVSLGFASITLREISVGDRKSGPSLRASGVVLDAGPLALALRGTRALGAARVRELHVRVPVRARASQELLGRLLARGRSDDHDATERSGPDLLVDHWTLELSDEDGELVRIRGARARVDKQGAQLDVERVRIGQQPASTLELERIAMRATRGPRGLQLRQITLARAQLRFAEQAQPAQPLPASPAQPASAHDTWQRLSSLIQVVTKASAAAPAMTPAPAPPVATAKRATSDESHRWLDRLTDDAELRLEAASIATGEHGPPILQGLHARLKMQPGRALAFAGAGQAQGGGAVAWDLVVRPEQVRADGRLELRSLPLSLLAPFLPNVPWYEPALGRVDAELVIKTEPAQGISFSGEASLHEGAISSPRIAPSAVRGIDLTLRGHGRFLPLQHRLEIAQAALELRGAALQVTGAIEWSADHYLFDIDATLPATACTKALRSIPEDLLGDMALASWQGKIGGHLRLALDSRKLDQTELAIVTDDHCDFVTVPASADLRRFRLPFIHSVLEPDGTLFEMETGPGTAAWTFLEDISPFFVHAVLAHEDAGFFSHHGFSPRHIRDALVRNLEAGRYVVGASTITMQLVKNVFLHREKTLARKIQEVLLTWWIERVMEKRDILELYLNVIEYGPSVYGIRNAAKHYFNRLPSQLSPAESIYLATILPNPKRYHLAFERGTLSTGWLDQMRKMLNRMRARAWYSPEAVDYGQKELTDFHFAPEGTVVPARQIPGSAAPLPYMQDLARQPGWGDDSDPDTSETHDDGDFTPLPALPRPKRAPGATRGAPSSR
jgi:hypothetical protein